MRRLREHWLVVHPVYLPMATQTQPLLKRMELEQEFKFRKYLLYFKKWTLKQFQGKNIDLYSKIHIYNFNIGTC